MEVSAPTGKTWRAEASLGVEHSLQALRAHPMRSGLSLIGILIGVVSITIMGAAINGFRSTFEESLNYFGKDVLFIEKYSWESVASAREQAKRRDINLREARELARSISSSNWVAMDASGSQSIKANGVTANNIRIRGDSENGALIGGLTIDRGRFLSSGDVDAARRVCVLGANLADHLFPQGNALGQRVIIGKFLYETIGILEKVGGSFFLGGEADSQVIIPVSRFVSDFSRRSSISIRVRVSDPSQMDNVYEDLVETMRRIRGLDPLEENDFAINQMDMLRRQYLEVSTKIAAGGLIVAVLSLFVGGVGIMNIMLVSVAERTREIGLFKALGAKRHTIMTQFLVEAALICFLGGIAGLMISVVLVWGLNQFSVVQLRVSMHLSMAALTVSTVTGLASGLLPAWRAAALSPVEALRDE